MSYIGNSPVLPTTEYREEHTVTGSPQSLFNTLGYEPGYISVYRNGIRLAETEDFLATDGSSVLLSESAEVGDIVAFEYRTEISIILDNSIDVSKLNLTDNSIPLSAVEVTANSIPVSAIDGLIDIDKINITANSISLDSIALTENGIPISAVDTAGLNLDAGAKADMFYENSNILTESYTITDGKNALSAGPITIADGVVVTVPANSVWTVV